MLYSRRSCFWKDDTANAREYACHGCKGHFLRHSGSTTSVGIRGLGELENSGTDSHSGWSLDGRWSHGSSDKSGNFKKWTRKGAETRQKVKPEDFVLPAGWGNVRFIVGRLCRKEPSAAFTDQRAGVEPNTAWCAYTHAPMCLRARNSASLFPGTHIPGARRV